VWLEATHVEHLPHYVLRVRTSLSILETITCQTTSETTKTSCNFYTVQKVCKIEPISTTITKTLSSKIPLGLPYCFSRFFGYLQSTSMYFHRICSTFMNWNTA